MSREPLYLLVLFASAFAVFVGRTLVPGHALSAAGTYEALVHVWCGAVLAVAILCWPTRLAKACCWVLGVLSAFEVWMFLMR